MERRRLRETSIDLFAKLARVSWPFVLLVLLLGVVGYAALYSAAGGAPRPYAEPQAIRFAIGVLAMLVIAMVDIRFIARMAWPLYVVGIALLLLVAGFGHISNGARRWVVVAGVDLQPSELMKLLLILALAAWFRRASWERVGDPLFLVPPILATAVPAFLILREPNLGTAVITLAIGGAIFWAAGVRWWKFALVIALAAVIAPIAYAHLHGYQRQRILTFLHPSRDPLGTGYNIIQSKIALGAGGMWGQGYLHGTQGQLDFLPEKQTDFIFALFSEEFGLVGGLALIGLLALVILYTMAIGLACRHQFGRLVAVGVATNLFLYVFVNIAMVMGAIPVGGVPLPLISYGGSAMLAVMAGFGVLLSAHVHRDVEFPDAAGG
ncbi:MAG: rod shape-determining protein RodA [Acetobacteraceae bacterium]